MNAPHFVTNVAHTSKEALDLLRHGHDFDLVLTDLRLPNPFTATILDALTKMKAQKVRFKEVPSDC